MRTWRPMKKKTKKKKKRKKRILHLVTDLPALTGTDELRVALHTAGVEANHLLEEGGATLGRHGDTDTGLPLREVGMAGGTLDRQREIVRGRGGEGGTGGERGITTETETGRERTEIRKGRGRGKGRGRKETRRGRGKGMTGTRRGKGMTGTRRGRGREGGREIVVKRRQRKMGNRRRRRRKRRRRRRRSSPKRSRRSESRTNSEPSSDSSHLDHNLRIFPLFLPLAPPYFPLCTSVYFRICAPLYLGSVFVPSDAKLCGFTGGSLVLGTVLGEMGKYSFLYQVAKVASLCLLWYAFSSASNIVGKQILNEFPYPMTLSMVHLIAINCFLGPSVNLLDVREAPHITRKYYVRRIVPLALGKLFASVSSHISIWRVPLSYAHTVKAVMPLFTVLLSIVIMKERFTLSVYLSLVPIVGGVMLATVTEVSFDTLGLVAALFSTLCFALQNIYSKKCMHEIKIHHLRLLLLISQLCCLFLFPIWMYTDVWQIITNLHKVQHLSWLLLGLPICGFLAFAQNFAAFTVISIVSPVSYSVANVTKRIVVISTSLLLLQNPVTLSNVCGMMAAVVGVAIYNWVKYKQSRRPILLPTTHTDTSSKMYNIDFTDYSSPMKII